MPTFLTHHAFLDTLDSALKGADDPDDPAIRSRANRKNHQTEDGLESDHYDSDRQSAMSGSGCSSPVIMVMEIVTPSLD